MEVVSVMPDLGPVLREQVAQYQGPSDGTVVRFEYTFDSKGQRDDYGKKRRRRYYTYVALWVDDASKWYLTGLSGALAREMKHTDFMTLLATENTKRAEVVVGWDGFKP